MISMTVQLDTIAGTEASLGWAGGHTLVVDRPEGRAGGMGLGFNGGQLIGLALGGCFCNDLRYVAAERGVPLGRLRIGVRVDLDGEPLVATGMTMTVDLETLDGSDPADLIAEAEARSTVGQSLQRGVPVEIVRA